MNWKTRVGLGLLVALIGSFILRHLAIEPLGRDLPEYQTFTSPQRPNTTAAVTPLVMGRAQKPRCGPAGEASCFSMTEISQGAYLVRHPRATFLIDSGIHDRAED